VSAVESVTTVRGMLLLLVNSWLTLPSISFATIPRPRRPTTIKPAPSRSATWAITAAGRPSSITGAQH